MSSTEQPLVTVFSLCYNNGRFVVQGLESVRNQTYKNIQHLIADDCSQDDSVSLVEDWIRQHDYKCTFIKRPHNIGVCKGMNELLRMAKGKYVASVSDDLWLPDKIARLVQIMENSPADVGVVYSDAYQIDEDGNKLPQMLIEAHRKFAAPPEGFLFDELMQGNFISCMTALIRYECYKQVGIYDEELCFEDWDMLMRISRKFRLIYDKVPSAKYRIVSTSFVRTRSEAMARSSELMRVKYFFHGWLNTEQGKMIGLDLYGVVAHSYQFGSNIPLRWKWALLNMNFSIKTVLLIICSSFGLPFVSFQKILTFGVHFKEKIHDNVYYIFRK